MSISWTTLDTLVSTGADFTISRITKLASVSGGALLAVDVTAAYDDPPLIPIGFKTAIVAAPGLSGVSDLSWSLQSTDTVTDGSYSVTIQTYTGTPLDSDDNPIGSSRFYLRTTTGPYAGNPTLANEVSLTWV